MSIFFISLSYGKKKLHGIQVPSRMIVTYLHAMLVTPHQYAVARTQNLEKTIQLAKKQYDKNKIIKTEL